jgi:Sec-independent protein translocase protein TatA
MSAGEVMVVLVTVFLVFGVAWLPKLGEALGRARLNYRRASQGQGEIDITPGPKKDGKPDLIEDAQVRR